MDSKKSLVLNDDQRDPITGVPKEWEVILNREVVRSRAKRPQLAEVDLDRHDTTAALHGTWLGGQTSSAEPYLHETLAEP